MIGEDEASVRAWLAGAIGVSRETEAQIAHFVELLREANLSQNLIAASTAGEAIWTRHIADSAQLLLHAGDIGERTQWIDLGSGPGLPGLIIALCRPNLNVMLVESRRLRCDFLRHCRDALELGDRVEIAHTSVERMSDMRADFISARAFAPLPRLLSLATRFAGPNTRWLLPKGRSATNELGSVAPAWQKRFHVEPSLTDADAAILVGNGIPPKAGPKR